MLPLLSPTGVLERRCRTDKLQHTPGGVALVVSVIPITNTFVTEADLLTDGLRSTMFSIQGGVFRRGPPFRPTRLRRLRFLLQNSIRDLLLLSHFQQKLATQIV